MPDRSCDDVLPMDAGGVNETKELRFSIASMMCATGTVAVLLTYLKLFEPDEFMIGLRVIGTATLLGGLLGIPYRRIPEAAFWSLLGAATAFLCGIGQPVAHPSFLWAWPLTGAITATSAVMLDRRSLATRMTIGSIIALLVLVLGTLLMNGDPLAAWQEIACGPLAGAIMVGVVWLLEAVRNGKSYSRATMVFVLTLGVVAGNVFGRWAGLL